jgi:hypothetical protein
LLNSVFSCSSTPKSLVPNWLTALVHGKFQSRCLYVQTSTFFW